MKKSLFFVLSAMLLSSPFVGVYTIHSSVYAEETIEEVKEEKDKKKEKKPKVKKPKKLSGVAGEIQIYAEKFATKDQKAKLEALIKQHQTDKENFKTQHDERLKSIKAQLEELGKDGDKEKISALKTEDKEIKQKSKAIDTKTKADFMTMLNADQKVSLNGALAGKKVVGQFKKAKLSKEQVSQIEGLAMTQAKENKEADASQLSKIVYKKAADEVLTEEQRALVIKPKKPKKEKKPDAVKA